MTKLENTNNNGFLMIRRGLFEHIEMGLMKGRDLATYIAIHFFADYETGVAYNISAPFLAKFLHDKPHKLRRSMLRLEENGYIKRFAPRGGQPGFDVVIDKFIVKKCLLTNAAKSKSIHEIAIQPAPNCPSTVHRLLFDCSSTVHRLFTIKEVKKLRIEDIKKSGGKTPDTPESFTPPSADEVKEYASTIGFAEIDAQHFCEYYAANEWRLKGGDKMRSWKQAVVSWKSRERQGKQGEAPAVHEPQVPTAEQLAIIEGAEK